MKSPLSITAVLSIAVLCTACSSKTPTPPVVESTDLTINLVAEKLAPNAADTAAYGEGIDTANYSIALGAPINKVVPILVHVPGEVTHATNISGDTIVELSQYYAGGGMVINVKRSGDKFWIESRSTYEGDAENPSSCQTPAVEVASFTVPAETKVVIGSIGAEGNSPITCDK